VPGYGVASFNGMTIGVSPGIMGTHNIVGNLPNLDFKPTQQLAQNVLGLSNLSGAYSPTTDPTNYPKGYDFSFLSGQPVGYGSTIPTTLWLDIAPSAPTGMGATGIFQNYSGQDVEDSYSHEPGSFQNI
jgi:hypothetical protein